MDILITLLAGLGFIFIGTHYLTVNMKQAAGPRFRRIVRQATVSPVRAAAVGIGSGAMIQSTNAVTFIVVGLVSAGAVTVQAGMPIVTWCYAGTTLRLLLVSIDVALLTYALVAAVGIAYFMEYHKSATYGYLVNAIMGLALLMVGVDLTAHAATPIGQSQTMRDVLAVADQFYYWGFIAGTLFATFMQGMTVSIIAVALSQAGVLGVDQTMLIVVGANVGSGLMSWMQGSSLKGTERQLSVYQVLLKALGALIMLPLLSVEHFAGVPTVAALVGAITADAAFQVTLVHWLYQIVAALAASLLNGPMYAIVHRLSPPSVEEELSRPEHLYAPPVEDPVAVAEQADREQRRLLRRLPDFLAGLRPEEHAVQPPAMAVLQRSGKTLAGEIRGFLTEAMACTPHGKATDRLYQLWNANEVLVTLHDELAAFVKAMPKRGKDQAADRLIVNLTEGLHALLEVVALELEGDEPFDPEMLARLTADRSAMMLRVRDGIANQDPPLPPDVRLALWKAIDLFERINWLLRRYAWSLGTIAPASEEAAPSAQPVPV